MSLHRFNVHFRMTEDIDVSVIVETEIDDESHVLTEAKSKLENDGLSLVTAFDRPYIIDHLETIEIE